MAEEIKKDEDWMQKKWRPAMGWMYMIVCMMDMVVFPILWSLLQSLNNGQVTSQWNPLTLQGAGLFHIAMGAVLGIAAFGRTQEKMAGAANNIAAPTWPVANTPPVVVAQSTPTPTMSSSGKLAPPPAEQPLL